MRMMMTQMRMQEEYVEIHFQKLPSSPPRADVSSPLGDTWQVRGDPEAS